MSEVDNATQTVATSETVAPPPSAGDPQGSAPAPVDTTANGQAKPEGQEPDKQSRRESRAFATQRREIRELHRQLGYMQAQMEGIRPPGDPQPTQDGAVPQQRQPTPPEIAAARRNDAAAALVVERLEEAGEEIEGFDRVMETITAGSFPMTTVMRDFLGETEKPADMAKWLADNPKEAQRISLLSDAVAVRAMEKAEARLKARPAPKNSTAPPPVPTVGGRSTPSFDPDKASMEEYAAEWKRRNSK